MILTKYDIYEAIRVVRGRPGMYIGNPSPENLFTYLTGYRMAMHHAGIEDVSLPRFHGLHSWISRKFGFRESTAGWANMILAVHLGLNPREIKWEGYDAGATPSQLSEATYLCFELIDEYRFDSTNPEADA